MDPTDVRPPRLVVLMLVLLLALIDLGGCSAVRVAYQGADVGIRHYADDYLDLDSERLAAWQPHLTQALARHRSEELPYLVGFFEDALAGANRGLGRTQVECLEDQVLAIYRRNAQWAVDLAAPLLAMAGPAQVHRLEERFRGDWAEAADTSPSAVARRERKRAERYSNAASWWIGALSEAQKVMVREVTASMPDVAGAWDGYRRSQQEGLLALVRHQADATEIHGYLRDWLVEHRNLPPDLAEARAGLREAITHLIVGLDQGLSPVQRNQLQRRLRGLRDDFLALGAKARPAGLGCP